MKYTGYIGFVKCLSGHYPHLATAIGRLENVAQLKANETGSPKVVNVFTSKGVNVASFTVLPEPTTQSVSEVVEEALKEEVKKTRIKKDDDAPITEKDEAEHTPENLFEELKKLTKDTVVGHCLRHKWSAHYYALRGIQHDPTTYVSCDNEVIAVYCSSGHAFKLVYNTYDFKVALRDMSGFQPADDIHHAYKLLGLC